jgi:hypothetical protein
MVKTPSKSTVAKPFYMVIIRDCLQRGDKAECEALLKGCREIQSHYGDLPKLITELETACHRAK